MIWVVCILTAVTGGLLLWNALSPMPAVLLLRRNPGEAPEFPADFEERREAVTVHRDLVYPSDCGRNRLDLYLPTNPASPRPLILWAHGGAFVAGDKSGLENWAVSLAAEGYAVAAVDYQLAPEASWPTQVTQLCDSCRWLKDAAEEYGLDLHRVVFAGDSAGAHMAAQLVLIHTSPAFREASGLTPVLDREAVKAALLYCGPYDISLMAKPKSRTLAYFMGRIGWSYLGKKHWQGTREAELTVIKDYVTGAFPPTYLTDGNAFSFEPQGRALAAEIKRQGVCVAERFFDPALGQVNHEYQFQMANENARLCYEDTIRFLAEFV